MGMEIPMDLINQLKISLRREANLSSYDPSGDSLPSLPSAADAISELDASAAYLRCRNCKGKLLRGIESLICVFCGKQQRTSDNPPDPIKFTSTSGYKWLLGSLNLDGSEIVEPPKETNGSGRGRNAPIEIIAVSKFLDLEIQWGVKEEQSANSGNSNGKSVKSKIPLNLGGLNLDDFFVEGRGDLSKVNLAESKPLEDDFKDPRSLSSPDSVKNQGTSELYQLGNVSLFEGKDAQKSISSEEHENLSFFAGRDAKESVSPMAHENLSLFEGTDVKESVSSKEHGSLNLFEGKDGRQTSSSVEDENFGSVEGVPPSSAAAKSVVDKFVDASSDWDIDFQSSKQNLSQEQQLGDPFVISSVDLSAHMDTIFGSGIDAKAKDSSSASVSNTGDWFQDDLFGNVNHEVQKDDSADHIRDERQVEKNGTSSMDIDWIGDDPWQTSDKKASDKVPTDEDEDWNDFASSANSKTPNESLSQTLASFQGETLDDGMSNVKNVGRAQSENGLFPTMNWTEDEKKNISTSTVPDKTKDQDDEQWLILPSRRFRSKEMAPILVGFGRGGVRTMIGFVGESSNQVKLSAKENSEINLFGEAKDHQGSDFGSFSSSDFFSGGIKGQNNSAEDKVVPKETSTSERRTGDDTTGKDQVSEITSLGDPIGNTAEELISQMHDLSFMLDTMLSVPPNSKTEQ
ncbi:PREDICTED: uncharacterized protein LOC104801549 [Tarenaya hassleriana]|uniref:uncharacterized protein LOC104801549 n=1 Tax=Tarenaya hassleriana TaxID=28532 RepID=UPI00053C2793|nr:PREDICTED: uncharacterized protein LOC104801549 [Tarenaya hassleriana]